MNYTEEERLTAVERFKQLDANITTDLNELVNLVAVICDAPVALVTLLDEDTQWFKAFVGTDLTCTDRQVAFCNDTIKHTGLNVIADTHLSEHFKSNPLVTGAPFVRFYAGAPLITKDGFAVGSLCIIDTKPRVLTEHQKTTLLVMAKQVVHLMELNWSLKTLEHKHEIEQAQILAISESEIKLKAIFDSSTDMHLLVDSNFEVIAFNKSAENFVKQNYKHTLAYRDNILDYTDTDILSQFKKCFKMALSGRAIKREWMMMAGTINACWKITTFIPVKNNNGDIIGVALSSADITRHKRQEAYINVQNEALRRIALIQSHELRRPVASLLGIMDLIKMEKINFDYFDLMEVTINELDEKIKTIVKDSENTLGGRQLSVVA
ncbi:PAS domain S-box protein [Mucilaginibacter achroorhodeus]|uniref:PAS domain S-box protein n=1 Tax=Mucilaginibacter achroorhodeus TaxID=2599294 RepID=A0A563U5N8_9SPHI|nr:GAF domain-containing protein [Mucilaginibacter achroorhodeus]TWR26643.1 PAS domain S-box protein [Mucilaginibacter achroorhodeus]